MKLEASAARLKVGFLRVASSRRLAPRNHKMRSTVQRLMSFLTGTSRAGGLKVDIDGKDDGAKMA